MISDGWFRQGHIDAQETCLITSNETYQQYTQTAKALEEKKQEEERRQADLSPEVQEVLDKGNEFLDKIHKSNDAIPGVEISAKISRMELIVEKIFRACTEASGDYTGSEKDDELLSANDCETAGCVRRNGQDAGTGGEYPVFEERDRGYTGYLKPGIRETAGLCIPGYGMGCLQRYFRTAYTAGTGRSDR